MHEKTAGTKKAPALDYGATAPGQNGLPHPITGLTVTGRTLARVRGEGKVWSSCYWLDVVGRTRGAVRLIVWLVEDCSLALLSPSYALSNALRIRTFGKANNIYPRQCQQAIIRPSSSLAFCATGAVVSPRGLTAELQNGFQG